MKKIFVSLVSILFKGGVYPKTLKQTMTITLLLACGISISSLNIFASEAPEGKKPPTAAEVRAMRLKKFLPPKEMVVGSTSNSTSTSLSSSSVSTSSLSSSSVNDRPSEDESTACEGVNLEIGNAKTLYDLNNAIETVLDCYKEKTISPKFINEYQKFYDLLVQQGKNLPLEPYYEQRLTETKGLLVKLGNLPEMKRNPSKDFTEIEERLKNLKEEEQKRQQTRKEEAARKMQFEKDADLALSMEKSGQDMELDLKMAQELQAQELQEQEEQQELKEQQEQADFEMAKRLANQRE